VIACVLCERCTEDGYFEDRGSKPGYSVSERWGRLGVKDGNSKDEIGYRRGADVDLQQISEIHVKASMSKEAYHHRLSAPPLLFSSKKCMEADEDCISSPSQG